MRRAGWWAMAWALVLGRGEPAHAQESKGAVTTEWYDVQIEVREHPPRGARLVFGLVNGDVAFDNSVTVKNLATAGGSIGTAFTTVGTAVDLGSGGFRLDDTPHYLSKWIQQAVTVGTRISFQVGVTRQYPWKETDGYQPDQFSLAVLEGTSNAGFLRSDDSTTANLIVSIDLAPGSQPRVYKPFPSTPPGKPDAWSVTVKPTQEPQ